MDFKQSVTTCLRKSAASTGRAARPEFWWFALFTFALSLVVQLVLGDIVAMLVNLGMLLPSLAVGTRRLHDIGKSGWFQLLWFIPLLGWIAMIYFLVQPTGAANQYGEGPALPEAAPALPPGAA